MSKPTSDEVKAAARQKHAAGMKIGQIAKDLGLAWITVKQIVDPDGKPARERKPQETAKVPEAFDMTITAPTERFGDIFTGFTVKEQAEAIAAVLQARLNAILGE